MQTKRLYVGNLNYKATLEQIKEVFEVYGHVVSVRLIERDGLKTGFGFVEFAIDTDAASAREALNDTEFMNRRLKIDFAKPRPEKILKNDL